MLYNYNEIMVDIKFIPASLSKYMGTTKYKQVLILILFFTYKNFKSITSPI
ncbi:hypothetical protein LguiA_008820 [Lonicera macranthoides]